MPLARRCDARSGEMVFDDEIGTRMTKLVFVTIAQNVAHNIFCKNYYSMFAKEKSSLKMWALL
jgi:hypothetical protein